MNQERQQQPDAPTGSSPKRPVFGWSTWLTIVGAYCGGYSGGLLGAILVGGLLLFLSRWRKIHVAAALILCPILFLTGSVLRTERTSQHAAVYRAGQTSLESHAELTPIEQADIASASPAFSEAITAIVQPKDDVPLTPSDETFLEYGSRVPELSLGNNWKLFVMQVTTNAIVRAKAGLPRVSDKDEMDQAMSEIMRNPGWTGQGSISKSEAVQGDLSSNSSASTIGGSYSGPYVTINFAAAKIGAVMQILADTSGYDLYIDDATDVVGSFRYVNERSDRIAAEIAVKYGLSIEYQGKNMIVTRNRGQSAL